MKKTTTLALGLIIAGSFGGIYAAVFDETVRTDFFAGFAGDSAALERGMRKAEAAIAGSPKESSEALAWHGGGLLFLSGQKFQQQDTAAGVDLWSRGNSELEKAGELAPDKLAVLIPRAAIWMAVSRFSPPDIGLPLARKAVVDFERVYEVQKPYFDTLSTHMRGELLFNLGDGFARLGQNDKARFYFDKLIAVGPATGHMEQAQLYMKGEKYEVKGTGCVGCHTGK